MSSKNKFDINTFQSIVDNNDKKEIKNYCNNLEKFHKDEEYELGEKDNIYHFNFIYSLPQNYKLSDYYNLFDFIGDVILRELELKKAKIENYLFFVYKICGLNKAQYILKKFIVHINSLDTTTKHNLLLLSSSKATLPVFLFWNKLVETSYSMNIQYLVNSCSNTDSRILSYMLDNLEKYKLKNCMNEETFRKMIMNLNFDFIPLKYFKRRLRWISSKFNIKPYWKILASYCTLLNFSEIFQYYYIPNISNQDFIRVMSNLIDQIRFDDIKDNFYEKLLIVFNEKDRKSFLTLMVLMGEKLSYINKICNSLKINCIENINNLDLIELFLLRSSNLTMGYEYNVLEFDNTDLIPNQKLLSKFLSKTKFSYYFINNYEVKYNVFYYLPFYKICKNKNINILLKFFKKICRVYKKTSNLMQNYYHINEMKVIHDKFTKIPPAHILPNQYNKLNGYFLLRPKADGVLVESLPLDCYPKTELNNYVIKAEYIEEMDLFLVFDINIPNKTTRERYEFLRKIHSATKNNYNIETINSLDELKQKNQEEDIILENFLNKEYDNYRWYPKVSFNINYNKFKSNIKTLLKPQDKQPDINTKIYETDGYILVPTDGSRELKIKPKNLLTIDIKYIKDKDKWVDRNNKDLSYMVQTERIPITDSIWRCYPYENNNKLYFVNKEIRNDKKKANQLSIIKDIISAYNWTSTNYYQKSEKPTNNTLNIIKKHNNKLINMISSINPNQRKSWLDLGCGKGKLINMIKKFNPLLYCGVDNDYNLLLRNKSQFKTQKNVIFKLCDLNKEINEIKTKIPVIKYDYIVINFAINHFYSRNFWSTLKFYCKNTTKIIFNITNDNLVNKKITLEDNGYIESDGNTTNYKFPWVHNRNMVEKFINSEELEDSINKNQFKINKKIIDGQIDFEKIYTWYVLSC